MESFGCLMIPAILKNLGESVASPLPVKIANVYVFFQMLRDSPSLSSPDIPIPIPALASNCLAQLFQHIQPSQFKALLTSVFSQVLSYAHY